jgi:hypothetical protein
MARVPIDVTTHTLFKLVEQVNELLTDTYTKDETNAKVNEGIWVGTTPPPVPVDRQIWVKI